MANLCSCSERRGDKALIDANALHGPRVKRDSLRSIKAVFCDVDGTLLTTESICSGETVKAISEVRECGYLFGLCTGRDAIGTQAQLEGWGLCGLVDIIVGSGGAEILDIRSGLYELNHPLSGDAIREIMAHYSDMDVSYVIPYRGVLYTPVDHPRMELLARADGLPYEVVDFDSFLAEPRPKVMLYGSPDYMDRVVERSHAFWSERYRSAALITAACLYEYMDPRISKPVGLARAAEMHGFTINEVLAFGDADNDAAMLDAVGCGVAMGNASDLSKEAADYVTADNDHDGIAHFLRRYVAG